MCVCIYKQQIFIYNNDSHICFLFKWIYNVIMNHFRL